jgi:hypothetical protein
VDEFPKPRHKLRAHGGPFAGQRIDDVVRSAEGRAWLAAYIPSRPPKHRSIGLAWLSWSLQREVALDDLDEIAGGQTAEPEKPSGPP